MKELLERILKQLPGYLSDLGSLLIAPKTTIVGWVEGACGDLARPLIFVGLSIAFGFLLQIPQLAKEQEFLAHAASMGLFKLVALAGFAAIIHLLFRAVGGRASFAATFSAYLYLASPLYLALLLIDLTSQGVVRAHDPMLVAATRVDPFYFITHPDRWHQFSTDAPDLALAYTLLLTARFTLLPVWFTACWGAFRRVHRVSRWRSSVAGVGAAVSFVLYFRALSILLLGTFGAARPPLM